MQHRVTIRDVAARAGVSAGAVSLALNDRPGVSQETRRRITEAARELGWSPNLAARSLARGPRVHTIGMAISREAVAEGLDALHMALIGGIENVLSERPCSLLLRLTASREMEIALYKQWWQSGQVNGAVLTGVTANDPRIEPTHRLGMPVVAVTHPDHSGPFPAVWMDEAAAITEAVRYLAVLGHRRIAHITGPARLGSALVRSRAFEDVAVELSLQDHRHVPTDLSAHQGARATRELLTADRPTAIVYDNDIMAVAGLAVAAELGLRVPEDVSLVAWDDSDLCQITRPGLSALSHDPFAFGSEIARCLLELLDTGRADSRISGTPVLVPRGTTGPPPRRP